MMVCWLDRKALDETDCNFVPVPIRWSIDEQKEIEMEFLSHVSIYLANDHRIDEKNTKLSIFVW